MFTVAELGFGTGLNCALTIQHWQQLCCVGGQPAFGLHFISVEAWPLHKDDLLRAVHMAAPAGSVLRNLWMSLVEQIGSGYTAFQSGRPLRLQPFPGVILELHIGDAHSVMPRLTTQADIWYLDGFAPGADPGLWSEDIYDHVTRCTRAQGTCSSFTAAGHVRRAMSGRGWDMQRIPGWGRKRHMLVGTLPETTQ